MFQNKNDVMQEQYNTVMTRYPEAGPPILSVSASLCSFCVAYYAMYVAWKVTVRI